jgi:hypothetical protein
MVSKQVDERGETKSNEKFKPAIVFPFATLNPNVMIGYLLSLEIPR